MIWHIIPKNDYKTHEEETMCECNPNIILINGDMIIVHNSFDGREGLEWANEILNIN